MTTAPARLTVGLVVYHTPLLALLPLFDLLQAESNLAAVGIFDNGNDAALRDAVICRGWHYLQAEQNIGFGAGHNRVFSEIGGAGGYHLIINPDVNWDVSPIPNLLDLLRRHHTLAAVMPDVFGLDGQRQYLAKRMPTPWLLFGRRFLGKQQGAQAAVAAYELHDFSFTRPATVPIISGCCMLCRSLCLRDVDGFDEDYFLYLEDYDLCRRWLVQGWHVAIEPAARIVHGHARSSYRLGKPLYWHICSALRYFRRWGWWRDDARKLGAIPLVAE